MTIRLEADLVKKVTSLKSKDESISSYMRALIEREYRERQQRDAAATYRQFLQANPDEAKAMDVWERASL